MVKNPAANAGDAGSIPVRNLLEKEMATLSSIFAWRIPGAEEPRRDGAVAHWVAKESDKT